MFGVHALQQLRRLADRGVDRLDRMLDQVDTDDGQWQDEGRYLTEEAFVVLADAPYPMTRNEIVSWAVNSGAEQEVVLALLSFPEQDWSSWGDVREALVVRKNAPAASRLAHPF